MALQGFAAGFSRSEGRPAYRSGKGGIRQTLFPEGKLPAGAATKPLNRKYAKQTETSIGPVQALFLVRHPQGSRISYGFTCSVSLRTDYVPASMADDIEGVWSCNVYQHYGMTEMECGVDNGQRPQPTAHNPSLTPRSIPGGLGRSAHGADPGAGGSRRRIPRAPGHRPCPIESGELVQDGGREANLHRPQTSKIDTMNPIAETARRRQDDDRETGLATIISRRGSTADLKQVHAPIGLDIGAETPAEIALSIVAEQVRVRAKGRLS